jgi:energy-coupling factor transporter ATP-binding protein EcfA2
VDLVSARVTNFKNIEDSTTFSVDRLTCLIGKNESGKTALLQALYKLAPDVKADANFDYVREYPKRHLTDYEDRIHQSKESRHDRVIHTTWELSDEDYARVSDQLGKETLRSRTISISKTYDNVQWWGIDFDELSLIHHLVSVADLTEEESARLDGVKTVQQLMGALESQENKSENQTKFLERLTGMFSDKGAFRGVANTLEQLLPKFVYFADYYRLPGNVSLQDLQTRESAGHVDFSDRVFRALLGLAGTTPEEIQGIETSERLIARLEGVSQRISNQVFEYWSQSKQLEVQFSLTQGRPKDRPPFNQGDVFRIRIRDKRHGITVGFDERSTGFVWFFSFLVWFSEAQKTYGDRLVVLLDEPGLGLHARAQEDLLRYLKESLAPKYQVIYTTHSPFMVDAENLLSVRTVEEVERGRSVGTRVGDDVLSTDVDTLFPLQAALGYDITQSLFVGRNALLVEGSSDLLYLTWISRELGRRGRDQLDRRWTITPVGGVDKISSFASLFGGNRLNVAALIDFSEGQKGKVRTLRDSEVLRQSHIFSAESYAGQAEADIEDILGRGLYVELVNLAYALPKDQQLGNTRPATAPIRVVREVEDHFRVLPPDVSEFDHLTPAVYLMEHTSELRNRLPELAQALDRFEKLFRDLNALLPRARRRSTRGGRPS